MKKAIIALVMCSVGSGLLAQLPPPQLYFPLDGTLPPTVGVMPVNGTATFGDGQTGFGLCSVTPGTALRAPIGFNEGMEPGTGNWTLSFWARFTWGTSTATMDNFRLFSKGGRDDSAVTASGYQIFIRAGNNNASIFMGQRGLIAARERFEIGSIQTSGAFKNGQWNHFVLMRRGDQARFYCNGAYISGKTLNGGAQGDYGVASSDAVSFCTQLSPESSKVPDWGLDDVATWMTDLTDADVAIIYAQGLAGTPLSGLVTALPAYVTAQDGAWETSATWAATPLANSAASVKHDVTASSALPSLYTLDVSDGGALALGMGVSLEVTKTGADAVRVGAGSVGALALSGGAAFSVAGISSVGTETGGAATLTLDAATLYAGNAFYLGHMGGGGEAAIRNGAAFSASDLLAIGNEGGAATLVIDGATLNVTNWLSIGRLGATGTLILTNNAVVNKDGSTGDIEFGNRSDSVSTFVMHGSTFNVNAGRALQIGKAGSRSTVSLVDSTINMGARMDFAHQGGAYVEANISNATISKADHDGTGLLFCEGGAATSLVNVVDSTISITRSGGTAANGIQITPSTGGLCVLTNINSVIKVVSTNESRIMFGNGINSRTLYVQDGAAASLASPGELRLGDGGGASIEFRQLDGEVSAGRTLVLAPSATATVDYWLSGGTLSARGITSGTGSGAHLIFDGGTYRPETNADAPHITGNLQLVFSVGKQAVFDTDGQDLAFLQFYAPQGSGGLTKKGAGSLRIPGTYTGATVVEQGTLALYTSAASSVYTVNEGAALSFDGVDAASPITPTDFTMNGTLLFNADPAGASMPRLNLAGSSVSIGANAGIAFPTTLALLPGKTFTFLETSDSTLGACALAAANIPAGWMIAQSGTSYILQETSPSPPLLPGRDDIIAWLSHETIKALPQNTVAYQVGAFSGTGVVVSNAPRNDLDEEVPAIYFSGANAQAMHGPSAPAGIIGNGTWAASMWVWSGNRNNNEPTVVCWGMRTVTDQGRRNCSLNHASLEARAASFFGMDPKYDSGAPALDSWQHIVFSYTSTASGQGQGLSVYVNGEPRSLNLPVNDLRIPDNGQSIMLGNQHNSQPLGIESRPYEGFIGELIIFDDPISQQEAAHLYERGAPVFVGSDALPDDDQVFERLSYNNWTNAVGWRNGAVPNNNSALVTGSGVSATVDSAIPPFKNLRVENSAVVNVAGATFRPDGIVAASNGAAVVVSGGGLLDPASHIYVASGSALTVTGAGSSLVSQALNNPVRVGNETTALSTLSILDGGSLEVLNSTMLVAYNTDSAPGNSALVLSNATLKIGTASASGNLHIGHQSGEGRLTAIDSSITLTKGHMTVASSASDGTAIGGLILDNTILNIAESHLRLGYCEGGNNYRSMNVLNNSIIRNKSAVTVGNEFVLGNRNAASDLGQPMTPNAPSVLVLDDSTLTLNNWSSVARNSGLGTLIITNNARVTKQRLNHLRIGTDSSASGTAAATNPYTEGRVHVSAGGILEIIAPTNELRIATGAADKGILTIGEGGLVSTYVITGAGTRGALEFDGGTLQARASTTNEFVTCQVPLLVNVDKDAVIDTQAYDVTIPRAFGGAGGIRKLGDGTLTLSAVNTNTGPVTVEAGTLELPDGSGVGGVLNIPAADGATVTIGASNVADTVSLGGLHLEKDWALEIVAPGECDTLILTMTAGITTAPGAALTLGFEPGQEDALFGNVSFKYLVAQAPAGCPVPVFANLPKGWAVGSLPVGDGRINFTLIGTQGTLLILK